MIFRVHTNQRYAAISTYHLRDTSLSLQAMGLLSFMLSCKDDFKFSIEGLARISSCGTAATQSALQQLKNKGYVVVSPIKDLKGKIIEWNYDVYENPYVEKPHIENPHVENQGQSNISKKDNSISSLRSDIQIEYSPQEKEKNNNSLLPPIIPQAETETQQPQTEKAEIITANELEFDEFRKIYRGTKRGLRTEFTNFCKKHKDWKAVLPTLKERYKHQCELKDQARMFGCFVPVEKNLQTYLNQRCWEEEPQFQRQQKRDSEKTLAEKMAEIELDYQINKQYGL